MKADIDLRREGPIAVLGRTESMVRCSSLCHAGNRIVGDKVGALLMFVRRRVRRS
jgi:hypothetical protein